MSQNDPTSIEAAKNLAIVERIFSEVGDVTDFVSSRGDDSDEHSDYDCYGSDDSDHFPDGSDDAKSDSGSESEEDHEWPHYSLLPVLELNYESDTEDYRHKGQGFPCKFYNHDGCSKGCNCLYSHAPDDKSERDEL